MAEVDRVGICGSKPDGPTWLICDLPAGHAGWHGADQLAEHPLGVSSRCSWTEREAAPTEYEREAAEVIRLTLEERYRKQIEELRAQNGRLIEERNRALSQARHSLERLYDKANNDHKGRACDFAHLLMRERLDHDQTRAHRDSLLVLETAAPILRNAVEALRALVELKDGPRDETYERVKPTAWAAGRICLRLADEALASLPPKPDTQS